MEFGDRTVGIGSRRRFGLDIGFVDNFNTQFVITLKHSATVNYHTLRNTTAHLSLCQPVVSLPAFPW
jgi:hypothetical protein